MNDLSDATLAPYGVLTSSEELTKSLFPQVHPSRIATWDSIDDFYRNWMLGVYLPLHRSVGLYTPDGLFPVDWRHTGLRIEFVGSCQSQFVEQVVLNNPTYFDTPLSTQLVLRNFPIASNVENLKEPDFRVVIPPLRYAHPDGLYDLVSRPDLESTLRETIEHLRKYLDVTLRERMNVETYVSGFIIPPFHEDGLAYERRGPERIQHFVQMLNEAMREWCEATSVAVYVDADEIASLVGKGRVDESLMTVLGHRVPMSTYDDGYEGDGVEFPSGTQSFDMQSSQYYVTFVRHLISRHLTAAGSHQVKLVVFDLDNTIWRGLASDGRVKSWGGRPEGIVEAIHLLRRRGIFVAIASKNDRQYIEEHWDRLQKIDTDEPLEMTFHLSDFDAVAINFKPKSRNVADIMAGLRVLPENTVFVDDNYLEREEVQAAFPSIRVLGSELNHVRRELLFSPFSQRPFRTMEDETRSRSMITLNAASALGARDRSDFLTDVGLKVAIVDVENASSPESERAWQLLNKTNQWNLNGGRLSKSQWVELFDGGKAVVVAQAGDRLNNYGIVAVAVVDIASETLTHAAVSCRVIGMDIDVALTSNLAHRFGTLRLNWVSTDNNRAAESFVRERCADSARPWLDPSKLGWPEHLQQWREVEVCP